MSGITASNYRTIGKGKVVASVDITITSWHLTISCLVIDGKDGWFLSLPSHKFTAQDGKIVYQPLVLFTDKDMRDRFQKAGLAAVNEVLGGVPPAVLDEY